ncbi:hypothetical protein [Rhodococcus zopfii]|uniref:hypothetical protein n=1 Tax=Rhodococcus zopfii TaxID=43772 RepID=UPI003528C54B
MSKSRRLFAITTLSTLSLLGVAGTAAADPMHRSDSGRCDVAIVDDHGRIVRIDEKSPGTRLDGLRCDDGLWRFTTDGNGHRRDDIATATLVRER